MEKKMLLSNQPTKEVVKDGFHHSEVNQKSLLSSANVLYVFALLLIRKEAIIKTEYTQ